MEYIKLNGLSYPVIEKHVEQIGDYSCADEGIEIIMFADATAIYKVSRRYYVDFSEQKSCYSNTIVTRVCTLNELKTENLLINIEE